MRDDLYAGSGFGDEAARSLLHRAREARGNAYAPYSGFAVGAALLCRDGRIFPGVNVENASYGLTTCAERAAVVGALSAGAHDFVAIAVVGPDDQAPCPPCGSCRQVLHEAAADLLVVTSGNGSHPVVTPLRTLLPGPFDGEVLRTREGPPR